MENFKKLFQRYKKLSKKKKLFLIGVFCIILLFFWAFIYAEIITGNFNRAQIKGNQNQQKVDAKSVIITETKDGKKYFEIYGETGNYSNDHSVAMLYNILGNFYKNGEINMSFQSSKGSYNENTGIITLYDNTYIVLSNGISLNADKFIWSGNDKDTVAEGHVKIKKNNEMLSTANKCIINSDYTKIKIIGNTTTKVWSKEAK